MYKSLSKYTEWMNEPQNRVNYNYFSVILGNCGNCMRQYLWLYFVSCEIVEKNPTRIKKLCMVDLPYFSRFLILFLDPPSPQQLRGHDVSESHQLRLVLCFLTWGFLSDPGAAQVVFHIISVSSIPSLVQSAAASKPYTHPCIPTAPC